VVQIDTAVYAGTQASYTITQNADYTYTVAGTGLSDTLTNMDQLKFLNNGGAATFYQLGRSAFLNGTGSTASGGDGNDRIIGTAGADTISTGLGNDIVNGGDGYDTIDGGAGNDTLSSGHNGSEITGGLGTNTLTGSNYLTLNNVVQIDTAVYAGTQASYTITQNADYTYTVAGTGLSDTLTNMDQLKFLNNGGAATFYQLGRSALLNGTGSTASGGDGNDQIIGTAGADTISTGLGNDIILAGGGNDILVGGAGTDTLTGGLGSDIFRYTAATDSIVGAGDVISDFNATNVDVINLQGLQTGAWNGTVATFATAGAVFANTGVTQIAFNNTSGLLQIDANGDGVADMDVTLTGVTALDVTDFTFV